MQDFEYKIDYGRYILYDELDDTVVAPASLSAQDFVEANRQVSEKALAKYLSKKVAEELVRKIKENAFIYEEDSVSFSVVNDVFKVDKPTIECVVTAVAYSNLNGLVYTVSTNRSSRTWKVNLDKTEKRNTVVFLEYVKKNYDLEYPEDAFYPGLVGELPLCIIAFDGTTKLSNTTFDIYAVDEKEIVTIVSASKTDSSGTIDVVQGNKNETESYKYGLKLLKADINLEELFFEILVQKLSRNG